MIRYSYAANLEPDLGGMFYPEIVCDACLQPITGSGNTYWNAADNGDVRPAVRGNRSVWQCTCAGRGDRCSHIAAVRLVVDLTSNETP